MAISFDDALKQFKTGGSFDATGYLPKGKTRVIMVRDSRADVPEDSTGSLYQETVSYYQGKASTRYMVFLGVLDGDNLDKLPPYHVDHDEIPADVQERMRARGAVVRIIPFVIPTTACKGLVEQLANGWQYAEVDENGTITNEPNVFVVNRTGSGLNTEYSVTTLPPGKVDTPAIVEMPNMALPEASADYTQYQERQNNNTDAPDSPADETGAIDESQF